MGFLKHLILKVQSMYTSKFQSLYLANLSSEKINHLKSIDCKKSHQMTFMLR